MRGARKTIIALAIGMLAYKVIAGGCERQSAEPTAESLSAKPVAERAAGTAPAETKRDHMESTGQKPYVNPLLGLAFPIQAHLYPVWFAKEEDGGFLYFVEEADRAGAHDVPSANRVAKIRGEVFPTPSRIEKTSWQKSPELVSYALEQRVQQEGGDGDWQLLVPCGEWVLQLVAGPNDRALLAAIAEGLAENE